ncbi:MAG TPA: tRNA (adenosine(37)-N6)-threonylcarbamoyltransferase complex dimerization subunit type 1 TsaB [Thermoleophilaceae bacterium]
MNVLGFDTSTAATSACVLRADGEAFERDTAPDSPAHASELLPAVAEVMERAGLDYGGLDAIAVGVGPGTFTGLRIGVATARALAASAAVELRPVSSLAALAEGIEAEARLPLTDAKRQEVFAALYEGAERRWGPLAAPPDEVVERVRESGVKPLAAGDGSVRFRGVLEAGGILVEPDGSRAHLVRALHICRLAPAVSPAPPEAVLPEYVRLPDAKPRSQ